MGAAEQYDAHVIDFYAWRNRSWRLAERNDGKACTYATIPLEMRAYHQWVAWRYEKTVEGKPTKLPYNPRTGKLASVTDPQSWSSFDEVVSAMPTGWYSGVGFVLTENDPFTFIDLDNIAKEKNPQEALKRQLDIFRKFDSYSERSPSGNGLHIIVKGKVAAGRRRSSIEIYSSLRYMTMTGDVFEGKAFIRDRQELLTFLWEEMGGGSAALVYTGDEPEKDRDEVIIQRALSAANGEKFWMLNSGNWQALYQSQSEADFAFINIVAFYTQNRAQIIRIFRASPLGQRDKAKRDDYVGNMVEKALDRELPPVKGLTELIKNLENEFSARSGNRNDADDAEGKASGTGGDADWPALDPVALHGLAGDIVRAIEPHTESDPVAILGQVLLAFGVHVGRGPHVAVEGDQHHGNIFLLLVGTTSKGRKGTSWSRVRQLFEKIPGWVVTVSGLSSGEGLKWAVRNPAESNNAKEANDPGVADKRLLVVESEFAQALRATARTGNTLSSTVREAWDTGNLRTLTKNDPIIATGAHVAIIGHITVTELKSELTATDRGNGFANRFLFIGVRRSKSLPFGGGGIDERTVLNLTARLAQATDAARRHRSAVAMTKTAREVWVRVYPTLSEGLDGLLGAVTGRAEAQCVRLALLYALLDNATEIDEPHLRAALALWEYCERSARYIFGSAIGSRIADEILRALRSTGDTGLTRTEISRLFKGHESADKINVALDLLKARNLAHCDIHSTGGRSVEVWRAGTVKKEK